MRNSICLILVLLMVAAVPAMAFGATKTGDMLVYGTVLAAGECTLSLGALGLGTITPPIASNIDTFTQMAVTCPVDTPYSISIATGGSGSYAQRETSNLITPSDKLSYNLFTDATYATIWGDGTGGTATVPGTGNGTGQGILVYARVPIQPTPAPGDYQDTVTVTLTY